MQSEGSVAAVGSAAVVETEAAAAAAAADWEVEGSGEVAVAVAERADPAVTEVDLGTEVDLAAAG